MSAIAVVLLLVVVIIVVLAVVAFKNTKPNTTPRVASVNGILQLNIVPKSVVNVSNVEVKGLGGVTLMLYSDGGTTPVFTGIVPSFNGVMRQPQYVLLSTNTTGAAINKSFGNTGMTLDFGTVLINFVKIVALTNVELDLIV